MLRTDSYPCLPLISRVCKLLLPSSAFMAGKFLAVAGGGESRPSRALDYLQLARVDSLLPANAHIDNLVHISLGSLGPLLNATTTTIGNDCSR